MSEYKVRLADTKHFSLTKDEKEIGSLKYKKWFSFQAEMILGKKLYQVEPKGFWGTTIELKEHGKALLNFKMHWNGNIIIKTQFDGSEKDFIFKHKGILKSSYILLDKDGQELLVLQPDFKWSKFSYDYTISSTDSFDRLSFHEVLILTTIHCANYYMMMVAGAIA